MKPLKVFTQSGADWRLIAIGGGSPQDTAKAIGITVHNQPMRPRRAGRRPVNPACRLWRSRQRRGNRGEVTIACVITDEEKRRKFVCVDPHDTRRRYRCRYDGFVCRLALKAVTGVMR
ncbi:iron-containing alcohol dehydrogenase [Salmonella enterica subsp. enterica]|nr:iron-containing alcohol dehydrogenase [Salmonella enterica subsp. enterica]